MQGFHGCENACMDTHIQDVVPMPSARIAAGRYEVLGTSRPCVVEKAVGGRWCLAVDGEFHESFDTKREALQYCQEHPEL